MQSHPTPRNKHFWRPQILKSEKIRSNRIFDMSSRVHNINDNFTKVSVFSSKKQKKEKYK